MGVYEKKKAELSKLFDGLEDFSGYALNRELFDEFQINGNRLRYENEYFARRRCLMARAANAIVNNKKDNAKLVEIIEAICDEFTWALPAHINGDAKNPEAVIDLFSAETAQTLSEILHYTELPHRTRERIHSLILDRIIKPYENNVFHWETSTHNWAAVCAGCVGMTYMYEFPERFAGVKTRLLNTMSGFLSGYGNDGACLEGLGYWGYGFGYFVYFSEMLRRFDHTDLLADKKIAAIAEFGSQMYLKNGVCVSFSDSFTHSGFNIGLACFLKKEFGARIEIPDMRYRKDFDECARFAPYLRSFLWLDESLIEKTKNVSGEKYFADAQWYINRQKKFAFAAKGGNNGEPHNHNDVGGFIIAGNEGQLIADLGAGEYTRDYFNHEKRYGYFCASSRGHSVPIIGGSFQKDGEAYGAKIINARNNRFVLDISGAYGLESLSALTREFSISPNGIILHDTFDFSGGSITERLVSLKKPESENGDIKIGSMIVRSDIAPEVSKERIKNHEGGDETVYIIDYTVTSYEFLCEFIF